MSNLHSTPPHLARATLQFSSDKVDDPHRGVKTRRAVLCCRDINSCQAGSRGWSARQAKFAKAWEEMR